MYPHLYLHLHVYIPSVYIYIHCVIKLHWAPGSLAEPGPGEEDAFVRGPAQLSAEWLGVDRQPQWTARVHTVMERQYYA